MERSSTEKEREEGPEPRSKEDQHLEFWQWRKDQQKKKPAAAGKRRKPGICGVRIPFMEAVICEPL